MLIALWPMMTELRVGLHVVVAWTRARTLPPAAACVGAYMCAPQLLSMSVCAEAGGRVKQHGGSTRHQSLRALIHVKCCLIDSVNSVD